jgi:hypothetical protein
MRKSISALVMLPLSANFLRPSALIASATCITPTRGILTQRDLALEILAEQFAPAFNGSSRADFGSISGWWSDLRPPIFVRQERPGEFK